MANYTPEERRVLQSLGDAATVFCELPRQHPTEVDEFVASIHGAQHLVMARFAQRHEQSGLTPDKGDAG